MSTYIPNEFTKTTVKSNITLRQLADIDESAGNPYISDNIRNNQILVAYSKVGFSRTFSFKYLSDILKGGEGVTVSTGTDGIISISAKLDDLEPLMIAYAVAL